MPKRSTISAAVVASGLVWAAMVATPGAEIPTRTVNDGVYSTTQANRGEAIFQSTCTTCHPTDRFTGPDFVSAWSGKPLTDLFEALQTMPEDNPGSLSAQQYGDVMAYFLSLNKFPAGSEELKAEVEVLEDIEMEPLKP